ncbi:hypothetical protein M9H77_30481 [Catharanthus roseus]|uniref:Uncharacterized protein n=1 Tax=Catharanthus roseus TaxID=4058 RepID=A0ACB9ZZE6_CATRO|nr:hypothetical protein M9H77_30481 [Catharanthus roseus]
MTQALLTPASIGAPLPLLSTSQTTPSLALPMMQDPPIPTSTRGPLPLPFLSQPTPSPAPPMMQDPPITSQPSASKSTQSVPDIGPLAWRSPPGDFWELLYLHVNQSGSKGPYHTRSEIPQPELDSRTGMMGIGKHTGDSISFTETIVKWQKDLTERFSRRKYIEELHKHQKGEKKGERNFTRSKGRPRMMLRRRVQLCPVISS